MRVDTIRAGWYRSANEHFSRDREAEEGKEAMLALYTLFEFMWSTVGPHGELDLLGC